MFLKMLRRSIAAVWLGLIALAANGIAQHQLNGSVIWAAVTEISDQSISGEALHAGGDHAAHNHNSATASDAEDLASMPPDCPMHQSAGHTHRGHSDCALCGPQGALAAFTLAILFLTLLPQQTVTDVPDYRASDFAVGLPRAPYQSRAPPVYA